MSKRQVAVVGRGTVRNHITPVNVLALVDDRALIDASGLVRPRIFTQVVNPFAAIGFADIHRVALGAQHITVGFRNHHLTGVISSLIFDTGADNWHIRAKQWHGLTLHVRTHQRTTGVIVFEERDQSGTDTNRLPRRHIHVVNAVSTSIQELLVETRRNAFINELAQRIQARAGLSNREAIFLIRRQISDATANERNQGHIGYASFGQLVDVRLGNDCSLIEDRLAFGVGHVFSRSAAKDACIGDSHCPNHMTVWCFDEPELVHPCINRQATDQTDVWPFRRFDRANTTIMAVVNVTNIEPCPFTTQTAGAKRRQRTLVRQFGQRVGLFHEL